MEKKLFKWNDDLQEVIEAGTNATNILSPKKKLKDLKSCPDINMQDQNEKLKLRLFDF
jgi:hypothetical protein